MLRRRRVRTDRESLRLESVTYVSGMNCYLCVRNGQTLNGRDGRIRTGDPLPPSHGRVTSPEIEWSPLLVATVTQANVYGLVLAVT